MGAQASIVTARAASLLLAFLPATTMPAQVRSPDLTAEKPPGAADTATLHVYAAHLQVPTLVLSPSWRPVRSLAADRFSIQLDGGSPFRPSSVRSEGDDPIALGVVIDANGDEDQLIAGLTPALTGLRTHGLGSGDSLFLMAVDCKIVRYVLPVRENVATVEHALGALLADKQLHDGKTHGACGGKLRLWDAMFAMTQLLAGQPARRVVLALSSGEDRASKNAWPTLRSFAAGHSVAMFSLTQPEHPRDWQPIENPLANLCALTGGMPLRLANLGDLPTTLLDFVRLLRDRYILEFPRANKLAAGTHGIDVLVAGTHDIVRTTGITVPLLDPKLRSDPNTVLYNEGEDPAPGTRRILSPAPKP